MFFNNRSDKKVTSLTKSKIADDFQKVWSISIPLDTEKVQTNGTLCKIRDAAASYQLNLDDGDQGIFTMYMPRDAYSRLTVCLQMLLTRI